MLPAVRDEVSKLVRGKLVSFTCSEVCSGRGSLSSSGVTGRVTSFTVAFIKIWDVGEKNSTVLLNKLWVTSYIICPSICVLVIYISLGRNDKKEF